MTFSFQSAKTTALKSCIKELLMSDVETKYYITLGKSGEAEFEEKKSLFIGYARPVKSEEEANAFIKEIKEKHRDATHNVYGYVMKGGILCRYSDDGEPQGTAGKPVLDVIRKSGVDDTAVVVTRYFGGTLLGTGGLVHAYSLAAKLAIENAGIVKYEDYTEMSVLCSYSDYQKINLEFEKNSVIIDSTDFAENVEVCFAVRSELADGLAKKISEISSGKSEPRKKGKRFDFYKN